MGPTLDEIITKLEAKEGLPLIKSDILATPVSPKLKDVKVSSVWTKATMSFFRKSQILTFVVQADFYSNL